MAPERSVPREAAVSRYGHQLGQGFPGLRFFEPLEHEFRQDYLTQNLHRIRLSASLALMMLLAVIGLDLFLRSQSGFDPLNAVRSAAALALILLAVLLPMYLPQRRHYDLTMAGCAALLGIAVAHASVTASLQGVDYLFSGVVLLTVFVHLFLGLLFYAAVLVNAAILAAFVGWSLLLGLPAAEWLFQAAILVAASLLCGLGSYNMEYALRKGYLESKLLQELAQRDGLTGLYNRRIFDAHLETLWKRAARERAALGILFFDIDYFKIYNDLYGHQAGDECLQRVARVLEGAARGPFDLCSRYGGEEFMLLLYDPPADFAERLPESLRRAVASLRIDHVGSAVARWVTVSIGAVRIHPGVDGDSPGSAIQLADQALYQAKKEGRDRVIVRELGDAAASQALASTPQERLSGRRLKWAPLPTPPPSTHAARVSHHP